uniref:Histone-lysine N-methyltransferase ASHR3 n=1 Tax=Zea mays TaxID=4577 RepID=A0A804LW53_MAIZE
PSPSGAVTPRPRRSVRVQLRVRSLPSEASSSTLRSRRRSPKAPSTTSIVAKAEEWGKEKAAAGAPEEECVLPFLRKGAPRKVECLICSKSILPDERTQCSVNHCDVTLHKACSEETDGCCPRHICFYCKKRTSKHRVQRTMPVCTLCLLKENRMIGSEDPSRTMISWSTWPSTSEDAGPTDDIKEAFRRLPLPYIDQEFNIDPINKQDLKSESEPPPYVHIMRNVYVVKKKSEGRPIKGGCINCDHGSTCGSSCSCRSSMTSCSLGCPCSVKCSNKPFRREKKIKIVKTRQCGWGAIALETIGKDDFVIEFVGEVIDDAMCEDRLQDMRQRRDQNFYMCKVDKDFVIDPTFKGNACRFFNHSCQPNCRLEKWQVNGKTRLGVFASQTIEVGMPLTYNYRFRTSFGPEKECFCGAPNCQGKL